MEKINLNEFEKSENIFLVPPYINCEISQKVKQAWSELGLTNHVFIFSSGTTSGARIKTYALPKESLKENAKAVNKFLKVQKEDKWLSSLPFYHVGGLGIYIRGLYSKAIVIPGPKKWNPNKFSEKLIEHKINFTSLVPTQLFDLVELNEQAPSDLKGVFIGGDFLPSELKSRALELGWPLIITFGMTETCSQIASSFAKNQNEFKEGSEYIEILPIHTIEKIADEFFVNSKSLASMEIIFNSDGSLFEKVKIENPFKIKDRLDLTKDRNKIKPLGRKGGEVKLKGRLVNFLEIRNVIENLLLEMGLYQKAAIKLADDSREGKILELWIEETCAQSPSELLTKLNEKLDKHIQIYSFKTFDKLPKTALGKVKNN